MTTDPAWIRSLYDSNESLQPRNSVPLVEAPIKTYKRTNVIFTGLSALVSLPDDYSLGSLECL